MRESFWIQNQQKGFLVGAASSTVWKKKKTSYKVSVSNFILFLCVVSITWHYFPIKLHYKATL